jgi:hypothetical protein
LKKIIYILLFTIGLANAGFSQNRQSFGSLPVAPKYMKYYPNPASSNIYFDFQNGYNQNFSLLIFNFSGKKVFEMKNMPSKVNINLHDFYRGIYIYQLRDKSGVIVESGKFQVIK